MNRRERRQIWQAGGPKVRWGQNIPFRSNTLLSFDEAMEINDALRELERPPTYPLWYVEEPPGIDWRFVSKKHLDARGVHFVVTNPPHPTSQESTP